MWSVLFVFLSYLDRNLVKGGFLDAEAERKEMLSALNGTLCAKMSRAAAGENVLYQVTDGVEAVRSVLSPAGRLLDCSVIADQAQVKALVLECWLGGVREGLEARFARMDEAKLGCREFQEQAERAAGAQEDGDGSSAPREKVSKRSKRGFTYPGTLWCGAGNMADDYSQLGEFAETDSCCRTHDHCPYVIHAFSSKYGYTNFKWHSICHCDCDEALKACLRSVNDTSSRVMGQAFFNVIGVPCFKFAYEEQCVERHWYGVCKRSERLPVAVLKEAVPYDFGGIDVIDVLTRAPPKMEDSEKIHEGVEPEPGPGPEPEPEPEPESATQSAAPGPEEPSLRNVVTAAEDFIKVLATVSTSQSSANDSDKGEAQSSEKKRRKNLEKKKKASKKRKGKGRKRKQKAAAAAAAAAGKAEEGSRAEEVTALSNFIGESRKHEEPSRVGEYELRGHEEPSNEVMKDEPVMDAEPERAASATAAPRRSRLRKGRRKKKTPPPPTEDPTSTAEKTVLTTAATSTQTPRVVGAGEASIVIPAVKRNRSKERGDRDGGKKRRKVGSGAAIVSPQNSSADSVRVFPHSRTETAAPDPERQVSHRPEVFGGKADSDISTLRPSFSVLKGQRSKERALRNRRRKTSPPLPSGNPLFRNNSQHVLPKPDIRGRSWSENRCECWRLSTAAKRLRPRKPRKKAAEHTELTTMTLTTASAIVTTTVTPPPPRTSSAPYMSPIQLSMERARQQFSRKKRRKAARAAVSTAESSAT